MDIVFLFLKLILGIALAYLAVVVVLFTYFLWRKEPKTLSVLLSLLWPIPVFFAINNWWRFSFQAKRKRQKSKKNSDN
ncbi:MAG: hypothetical protein AAB358_01470 [Patescibacteria group bacterium]